MTDCVALVLAAGLGTRMKSGRAKVLHRVLGRPMVIYPIEAALAAGVERVVVVVGHQREALEASLRAHFGASAEATIAFAVQDEQLGTGHAVLCGLSRVEPSTRQILVLNGDLPNLTQATVKRLLDSSRRASSSVGLLTTVVPDPAGLGRIVRDAMGRPTAIVEHKDADEDQRAIAEINVGAYLFDAEFMRRHIDALGRENAAGEFYLTDLVASAATSGRHACAVRVSDFEEVAGVNTRVQLADAEAYARRRRNRELMLAGVTMRDPETTWVEADCQVAADVILGPGVVLRGQTRVAEGVEIDVGAVISDSEIGAGSQVLAYSHMDGAVIGRDARIGPFARLRPGAVLRDQVRIGNFVEIKKSTIGVGSKANHLTYLGDATVGERVNVGAGTITCNYDGTHKHPTVLGDGVFVGSDTQFIAPVRVGERAYIAAGSTVTDDVPAGALAISRCRQTNKEGYTARRKEREKTAKE